MTYPLRINPKGFEAGIADKPRVLKALENDDITTLYRAMGNEEDARLARVQVNAASI